ncbi:MAG: hypothetical protein ACLPVO_09115 [Desulfomonilaceae bacterium]
MRAARAGYLDVVKILLDQPVELEAKDEYGATGIGFPCVA